VKKAPFPLAALLLTLPAFAEARTPVSSLATLPAPKPITTAPKADGVKVDAGETLSPWRYVEAHAAIAQGYCFVSRDPSMMLQVSTMLATTSRNELWHLREAGDSATLERSEYSADLSDNTVHVKGRSTVKLAAVAQAFGVTAWAFRDTDGAIILLARGGDFGRQAQPPPNPKEDKGFLAFPSSNCSFGATRIDRAVIKTGAVAHLRGNLPKVGEGKSARISQFSLDVTVGKLTRDPEPMLSVRLREIGD
jgi:hypothetical protein